MRRQVVSKVFLRLHDFNTFSSQSPQLCCFPSAFRRVSLVNKHITAPACCERASELATLQPLSSHTLLVKPEQSKTFRLVLVKAPRQKSDQIACKTDPDPAKLRHKTCGY
uniref:(northern house mosquito) hypothetical protein n=1 Tax=Culex pipiens TaxID=7175 RepID=A0A8D8FLH3_CULPI